MSWSIMRVWSVGILIGFLWSTPLSNLKRSQENGVTNIYYLLYSLYINAKYYSHIHSCFSFSKTNDHITMKLGTKLTLKSLTLTKKQFWKIQSSLWSWLKLNKTVVLWSLTVVSQKSLNGLQFNPVNSFLLECSAH